MPKDVSKASGVKSNESQKPEEPKVVKPVVVKPPARSVPKVAAVGRYVS